MEEIRQHEFTFALNNYRGQTVEDSNFTYIKGVTPILISAPHSVFQIRDGKLKYPEVYTGAIASMLHEEVGVHLLVKTATDNEDPNDDDYSAYRDALVDIVKSNRIFLVIDLHGSKSSHDFCIDVGTNKGSLLSRENMNLFRKAFSSNDSIDFRITENQRFGATGENVIANNINARTGIDAMQLEINKLYRSPETNIEEFRALIVNLSKFVYLAMNHHLKRV